MQKFFSYKIIKYYITKNQIYQILICLGIILLVKHLLRNTMFEEFEEFKPLDQIFEIIRSFDKIIPKGIMIVYLFLFLLSWF